MLLNSLSRDIPPSFGNRRYASDAPASNRRVDNAQTDRSSGQRAANGQRAGIAGVGQADLLATDRAK